MSPLAKPPGLMWQNARHSIDTWVDGYCTQQQSLSSTAWGTQYRAIYVPVRVPERLTVVALGCATNSTGTNNLDIGIYDSAGRKIITTTSTAKVASATIQVVDIADTVIPGPGTFYLALNSAGTTDTFYAMDYGAPVPCAWGVRTETLGSVTLPDTATWVTDNALSWVPVITALLGTEVT